MDRTNATVRDVAAQAGCSIATVSRVATAHGPVSDNMRQRVVAAALRLGFPLGQTRKDARSIIGVLLPSVTNPVFAAALAGIEQCARTRGLSTIVAQSNYDVSQEDSAIAALIVQRPVGLIMTVRDPLTSATLSNVARQGLPAVTIYNSHSHVEVGSVSVDNRLATATMTECLVSLGHRIILFVAGSFVSSDRSMRRYEGYRDAMTEAGYVPLPAFQVDFIDAAQDIDLTAVMAEHSPTAIVASNDLVAVTVIASLRHLGLEVPHDVSVAGFDGIEIARHMTPKLTTIAQPSRSMGVVAASMMLDIAAGRRRPRHIVVEATFFRCETIGPPNVPSRPTRRLPTASGTGVGGQRP